jgi:hypothetical protein
LLTEAEPERTPNSANCFIFAQRSLNKSTQKAIHARHNVAAAQLGPIQKADSREAVVKRMIALNG